MAEALRQWVLALVEKNKNAIDKIYSWQNLFQHYAFSKWEKGGNGGADISRLETLNSCLIELRCRWAALFRLSSYS